jgi:hypothetical protein
VPEDPRLGSDSRKCRDSSQPWISCSEIKVPQKFAKALNEQVAKTSTSMLKIVDSRPPTLGSEGERLPHLQDVRFSSRSSALIKKNGRELYNDGTIEHS